MAFNNVKNLFSDVVDFFKNISLKDKFTSGIKSAKNEMSDFKYKLSNLFETNLKNGLTHYYDGHYYDALTRFKLMDTMWKNNPSVNYNLGRAYFMLKKNDKARNCLNKALGLNPRDDEKIFIEYFLKKIDNVANLVSVPEALQEEFYDHSISSEISNSEINRQWIKKIFDLYNRYIGSFVVNKREENVNILELGCFTGHHGSLIRSEFRNINLDGLDISQKMYERCKDLKVAISSEEVRLIYDRVWKEEMHQFLSENIILFTQQTNKSMDNDLDKQIEKDIQNENLSEIDDSEKYKAKLYDVILSLGVFADFGELSVVVKLAEMNLVDNGLLIFSVPESKNNGIQFSIYQDYFLYGKEYVENTLKETSLSEIDRIEYEDNNSDERNIMFIFRKVSK